MFKHCFHYGFAVGFVCGSWLRLRKLASFAENVRDDCTPRTKPISSAQDRRHNNLLTSHAKNKARRSKPHRAFITVLKDALLCMSPASFASKIRSAKFVPQCQVVAMQSCNILPRNICGRRSRRGSGQLGPTDPGTAFSRFEHIAASINLVLRSARLRASRRTATSEIERAAILRDGRMQACALLRMRPSRRRSDTMIYGRAMLRRPHVLEKPRRAQPGLAPRCPVR